MIESAIFFLRCRPFGKLYRFRAATEPPTAAGPNAVLSRITHLAGPSIRAGVNYSNLTKPYKTNNVEPLTNILVPARHIILFGRSRFLQLFY